MIAVVDYSMGNVTSVQNAFELLGIETVLTHDRELLDQCSGIVVPGVGAFGCAALDLEQKGLVQYLKYRQSKKTYILGICLGLQLFFEESEEDPGFKGMHFFPGKVLRFPADVKVPHMGWNRIIFARPDPIFAGVPDASHFYFAHSYYANPENEEFALAHCHYGTSFAAAVKRNTVYGLQFHPEKSGGVGLKILRNFERMVSDAADSSR